MVHSVKGNEKEKLRRFCAVSMNFF